MLEATIVVVQRAGWHRHINKGVYLALFLGFLKSGCFNRRQESATVDAHGDVNQPGTRPHILRASHWIYLHTGVGFEVVRSTAMGT